MYDFVLQGYFNKDVDTVFCAFHEPEVIVKWFAPDQHRVSRFLSSFEVGGQYCAVITSPDDFQQTVNGCYHSIEKNKHLSFTWRWDDTNEVTKVNLEFSQMPNLGTSVILTQSGFYQEQDMLLQQGTWMDCLEKLSLVINDLSRSQQSLVA